MGLDIHNEVFDGQVLDDFHKGEMARKAIADAEAHALKEAKENQKKLLNDFNAAGAQAALALVNQGEGHSPDDLPIPPPQAETPYDKDPYSDVLPPAGPVGPKGEKTSDRSVDDSQDVGKRGDAKTGRDFD